MITVEVKDVKTFRTCDECQRHLVRGEKILLIDSDKTAKCNITIRVCSKCVAKLADKIQDMNI